MKKYQRFRSSRDRCPTCGGVAQEDAWPPNYGGVAASMSFDGSRFRDIYSSSVKHVCWSCHIQWIVVVKGERTHEGRTETRTPLNVRPMVERGDQWLTEHDVWRESYREKHGEYPSEAYG